MSKPKIAMIGAGSLIFCKTLTMDILATEALQDVEICLMNRTRPKLDKMEAFVRKVVKENHLPTKVTATLDRREALDGATYVINMIQVGGVEAFRMDYEIPIKYGVNQCIADSIGPGGVFRALRTIPVLADMSWDMNELCPEAILLNYANPMGANCSALGRVGPDKQVRLVRAFNVLRQYEEDEVWPAWDVLTARLLPGGLLLDGAGVLTTLLLKWVLTLRSTTPTVVSSSATQTSPPRWTAGIPLGPRSYSPLVAVSTPQPSKLLSTMTVW